MGRDFLATHIPTHNTPLVRPSAPVSLPRKRRAATLQLEDTVETDLKLIEARLSQFEARTGASAPRPFVNGNGAPTRAFLRYARASGLSLDWLVGDVEDDAHAA